MNEADEICNRVGIINHGEVMAIGSPTELKALYQKNQVTIEYEEAGQVVSSCFEMGDVEKRKIISKLNDEGRLISMNRQVVSLADVFFEMTGGQLS